jgi:cyclase
MPPPRLTLLAALAAFSAAAPLRAQIGAVQNIAPGVYFHQGDPRLGTCNNGWVVMDDYVVEIDANFPVGAKVVIPKIRAITAKPVRYVVDTHFHPDHASGNDVWAAEGATIVAQSGTLAELRESGAAAWELLAKSRPDIAASRLRLPSLVYTDSMAFDDGGHRIELRWPGIAHTHGDTLVWLPREKILFTGDVCVNGSYNYLHDSNVGEWIKALDRAKSLGALQVCPGHGPIGGPEIIADQEEYFVEVRAGVKALMDAGKSAGEIKAAAPALAAQLRKVRQIARYVPTDFYFAAHVEKNLTELGGLPFPK